MECMCVLRAEIPTSPLLKAELGLFAEIPLSSQNAFHLFYKTASHFNKIDFEDNTCSQGHNPNQPRPYSTSKQHQQLPPIFSQKRTRGSKNVLSAISEDAAILAYTQSYLSS